MKRRMRDQLHRLHKEGAKWLRRRADGDRTTDMGGEGRNFSLYSSGKQIVWENQAQGTSRASVSIFPCEKEEGCPGP